MLGRPVERLFCLRNGLVGRPLFGSQRGRDRFAQVMLDMKEVRRVMGAKVMFHIREWLLLDSRVVDVPMAYDPPFVMPSSLKPLFFNSLKHKLRFSDNTGA